MSLDHETVVEFYLAKRNFALVFEIFRALLETRDPINSLIRRTPPDSHHALRSCLPNISAKSKKSFLVALRSALDEHAGRNRPVSVSQLLDDVTSTLRQPPQNNQHPN
jgi:hypothetical protein